MNAQQLRRLRFPPSESSTNRIQRLSGRNSIFFLLSFFSLCFVTSYLALTRDVSSFIAIDEPKESDEYLFLMISSQSKVIRPLCSVPLPSTEQKLD